jgi:hypothetical protein
VSARGSDRAADPSADGAKTILHDSALAELYQVPTKVINQALKRNLERFPEDFMFRLASEEANSHNFVTLIDSGTDRKQMQCRSPRRKLRTAAGRPAHDEDLRGRTAAY